MNILKNYITGFFKTYHNPQRGWMLNNYPIKLLRGTKVKIKDEEENITPGMQKVFTYTTDDAAKSMIDKEKLVFRDLLQKTGYYNRKPTKSSSSGRDRYIENDFDNDVRKFLNLDTKLRGRGFEKIIIPSIIFDIYTRLGVSS